MINRPLDLLELLDILWRPEMAADNPEPTVEDYRLAKPHVLKRMLSEDDIDQFVWLLDPDVFKALATPDRESGMLDADLANSFIPPILGLVQLRRTSATVIENVPGKGSYRIGGEIPHLSISLFR